jgi:carbamoyltransferase
MIAMGVHFGNHDSSCAAVTSDGNVVQIAEERLSGRKRDGRFPSRAIQYCMEALGVSGEQIDCLAVDNLLRRVSLPRLRRLFQEVPAARGQLPRRIVPMDHHLAHAQTVALLAGDRDAAVLVVDGGGNPVPRFAGDTGLGLEFQTSYRLTGRQLIQIAKATASQPGLLGGEPDGVRGGVGTFYAAVSAHLGFGALEAGKTMGLAGYGRGGMDPGCAVLEDVGRGVTVCRNRDVFPGGLRERTLGFVDFPPVGDGDAFRPPCIELAWYAQHHTELAMLRAA